MNVWYEKAAADSLVFLAEHARIKDKGSLKERRERIATAVLAGLNSHGGLFGPDADSLARRAARMADALIAELDK